ncbi:NAD-dependent epimerase/dehydratase family protein [Pontibacter sp. G13]|uniref:NAD-dependent epimerase/dehydratase family protein n=1 Tax=Pontibacter sp. G13 TaxID=3074898 RepID=UPI00288C02F1|nr:NAD-dependent epimerase/dehydratase family protein [Pontibacter sp. G13]WNJ20103.1 NAD-dependent epimerase/dehydratase family protein [Pontibacter sp. G13]
MRMFITGASGFIGGAIARSLGKEHEIHAMARSQLSAARIERMGFTPVRCALGQVRPTDLAPADCVIHAAAMVDDWGTHKQFWQTNVEGTRQLLKTAQVAGVRKFIHISTEAVLMNGGHLMGIDERTPYPKRTPFFYSETKREAEKLVVQSNIPGVFETMVLRPRFVWGPGDKTILPALVDAVKAGTFVWVDKGKALNSPTHVDNLVHGLKLMLQKGTPGEIYFITDGELVDQKYFLTELLHTQGIEPPEKSLPSWAVLPAARMADIAYRLAKRKQAPPITYFAACLMAKNCVIRIDKAKRELGYRPIVKVAQGLEALKISS